MFDRATIGSGPVVGILPIWLPPSRVRNENQEHFNPGGIPLTHSVELIGSQRGVRHGSNLKQDVALARGFQPLDESELQGFVRRTEELSLKLVAEDIAMGVWKPSFSDILKTLAHQLQRPRVGPGRLRPRRARHRITREWPLRSRGSSSRCCW